MTAVAHVIGSGLVTCLGSGGAAHVPALRTGHGPTPRTIAISSGDVAYHSISGNQGSARLYAMLAQAIEPALQQAGIEGPALRRMAVCVGSSCLDLPVHEAHYEQSIAAGRPAVPLIGPGYGMVADQLAERFGIDGPQYTFNTACSSSANALMHARLLLADGLVDHVLVAGVETFNRLSLEGFGSLLLLARDAYRPFDRRRTGLILGEGAAAMVLSRAGGETSRLALVGGASACDPSSPTSSRADRVAEVMATALEDAGVGTADLIAIKAHGTGTTSNDRVEGEALCSLSASLPPFTSLKPYVGHTLGACGLIETLMLDAAWRAGFLPATPGFEVIDPEILVGPATTATPLPADGSILCNFFGFGGNNTSLVFTRS